MTAPITVQARLLTQRRAGVLLHPTSLDAGRGAFGAPARAFIDWLAAAGFTLWQTLPLAAVGPGGSPYWARSDFAGEPGLIDRDELPDPHVQAQDFEAFIAASAGWLDDYVLFEALAERFEGAPWWRWPEPHRDRDPETLAQARASLAAPIQRRRLEQWQFDWQWRALRGYAAARGIYVIGDLPIYVAPDSVSTWAHREQFQLHSDGTPAALAGVPPDYFSADGQLWGNPLYNWQQAQRDGFAFWRARAASRLSRCDIVRIDHFRALAAYWSVPAGETTARVGRWLPAPGHALLQAIAADHPQMPFIAEDLGYITPDVIQLRQDFGLPGMHVLQFGFGGGADNPHLPHNYVADAVAYTGTHDNDTSLGWYRSLDTALRAAVDLYLGLDDDAPGAAGDTGGSAHAAVVGGGVRVGGVRSEGARSMPGALVHTLLASVAGIAVVPAQDLLGLGSEGRLNRPGTVTGNWTWRLPPGALTPALAAYYAVLNRAFGRYAGEEKAS